MKFMNMLEQYDHKTLLEMFDGKNISPVLPYDSIDADAATIEASTQAGGRISISGVQPKYAMVADGGILRFAREGEQGRYILKIAPIEPHIIEKKWVPINEYLTMHMASDVYGIDTAKSCLCYFRQGDVAYLTRRFDVRADGKKWLQEDFASIANISKDTDGADYKYNALSYAECGALIDRFVSAAMVEKLKFFRLVVFNYLTCNDDAHLKNFSLMSIDGRDFRMTPAYDLLNTHLHLTNPHIFALTKGLYPGMILNDTHPVTGMSFREFGRLLNLPSKIVERELDNFSAEKPLAKEMIENSDLSEPLKRLYFQVYDYRRHTLSF